MRTVLFILLLITSMSAFCQNPKTGDPILQSSEKKKLFIEKTSASLEPIKLPDSIQWIEKPCPYKKAKDNRCPVCKKKDKVIPIIYGLIGEITDSNPNIIETNGLKIISDSPIVKEKNYKIGGCVIRDCQPSWFCERDEKKF